MELNSFEYKNLLEQRRMSIEELSAYHRERRSYEYSINKPLESSEFLKQIHGIKNLCLKIDRFTTGRKLIIYDDKRLNKNSSKGKVYAFTHVGRYDIESALEAIGEQAYFIMGDAEETYRNFEGFFLDNINGRISFDTGYQIADIFKKKRNNEYLTLKEQYLYDEFKKDRHICEEYSTMRVARGDRIAICPEGAWNTTPRIVQPIFDGAARIAIKGNGNLVPIGILRDGKTYSVNIGKEIDLTNATLQDVKEVTKELRENMCSLVGEMIFNQDKITSRSSMATPEENELAFINDIMSESENGYTLDVIKKTRYYDNDAPENVYKMKKNII